ncbi:GldG family protein [Candidatus Berkiella aquae]|uniref:ABC-type uncharacterized transport system n=1 Tax=Candidatus Berkiella aquae TaxID=295108 RepID=A0A0Q9YJZ4_9GAMM|nr:Gldg family protein [Candidatus Berkiella aquae]MCS5710043.1 GldG family protein [Candidatus Berkiella aquae]
MMLLTISKKLITLCLLIGFFVSIYLIANPYHYSWNMTATQKLSPTTLSLLEKMSESIEIDLYSSDIDNYRQAELLITQYQSTKPNIVLHWKDRPYSFSNDYQSAALLVKMGERQEVIDLLKNPLNEQTLSQCLFKLCNKANQWIVFLQGHNEPSPFNAQATDYSLLSIALRNQGFQIQTLSLTHTPLIADNTRLLIIAAPRSTLLPEEEKLIIQYLLQGGNLLWLIDNNMQPLPFLSDFFQVTPLPGTIVDLHGYRLGTPHPAITIIDHYPQSPFATPKSLTAFPYAVALKSSPLENWSTQSLLITHEQTWTETGSLTESIAFEPEKNEVAGPLLLGIHLTRPHPLQSESTQRIAIIGNSRFLSNGVIENYGNLALGLNLIHWLGHDDALITLNQPINQDELIQMHFLTAVLIQYGVPSCLFLCAFIVTLIYLKRLHKKTAFG